MNNYYVKNVQLALSDEIMDAVFAEANLVTEDGDEFFVAISEIEGIPAFYKSNMSILSILASDEGTVDDYDLGIEDYDEVFENPNDDLYEVFRLLISFVCGEWGDDEKIVFNKEINEITIPVTEIEEEYLEG